MSLFSRSKEPEDAREVTVVFEIDRGYDKRLFGNSRPVSIFVDGEHAATLAPGESQEVRVKAGKRKFTFSHKDGKTNMTRTVDGNMHCFVREDKDGTDIGWNSGGGILSPINGEKSASSGAVREAKVFFRAEAGLTGRDRKVDISIDGVKVATLGTGERYQHVLETGTHVFQLNEEISRQVVQKDIGCFIQLGKKTEFQFFDPKSLMGKNMLRREPVFPDVGLVLFIQ
jgi:hypothetical protein